MGARQFLPRAVWAALVAALALRLLYLGAFGDRFTAYGYEHGFAIPALALLRGDGLLAVDDYTKLVDHEQFKCWPRLLQPRDYPPPPAASAGYYHATDMPGYSWFLAGLWRFFWPPTFWPAKLVQGLASAALVLPAWDIARRLFGRRAGVFAAWLCALWLPFAYLSQMVSKEGLEGAGVMLCAWFALRFMQEGRRTDLAGSALAVVASAYLRTNLLVIATALGLVGLLLFPWRRCGAYLLVTHLALAICLAPWVARNHRWVDPHVGLKEGFWWGILGGLAQEDPALLRRVEAIEGRRVRPDGSPNQLLREPPEVPAMTRQILRERPVWFVGLVAKRFLSSPWYTLDWGFDLLPKEARSYAAFRADTGKGRVAYYLAHPWAAFFKTVSRLAEIAVGTLALAAFWVCRSRWRECLWIGVGYGAFMAVYAPIHLEFRYVAPHSWALLVLAAACLANLPPPRYPAATVAP